MIISRHLIRELLWHLLVACVVLMLIVISTRLMRYFAEVAEGLLPVAMVWPLAGLKLLWSLVLIVPLAYFFSVVATLGRWYRDSEADALAAAGVGLPQLARPVLLLGLVVALVTGLISFWLAPWSAQRSAVLEHRIAAEADSLDRAVGNFRRISNGRVVIYAERLNPDNGQLEDVFVRVLQEPRPILLIARAAFRRVEQPSGHEYLVLQDGRRYDGTAGQPDFRMMDYRSYAVLVQQQTALPVSLRAKALPTTLLLAGDRAELSAELHWRLAAPIGVLLLTILALPLSHSGPRSARGGKLLTAILVYLVYNQLMGAGQSWIARELMPVWMGLWWVHLLLLALAILLWDARSHLGEPVWRRLAERGR
ncbi:MAG: LPS export ABC transporter permease LptF [Gammaproteobacteria bacterium]|nr:LPS export ABC transporter permease LptF [Gammaproteobacteria bacterium]